MRQMKVVPLVVYAAEAENDSVSTYLTASDFDCESSFSTDTKPGSDNDDASSETAISKGCQSVQGDTTEKPEGDIVLKEANENVRSNEIVHRPTLSTPPKRKSSLRSAPSPNFNSESPTKGRRLSFSDENGGQLSQIKYVKNCHYPKKTRQRDFSNDSSSSSSEEDDDKSVEIDGKTNNVCDAIRRLNRALTCFLFNAFHIC